MNMKSNCPINKMRACLEIKILGGKKMNRWKKKIRGKIREKMYKVNGWILLSLKKCEENKN